ncbi:hypothetical protein FACS1894211_06880 [Clostridia bacterium]|nr:hypothetical protein FACS1894211_06880 [Clostridia bacterium]
MNTDGQRYVKSDETVIEFCKTPRSASEIAKFVGVDKSTILRDYVKQLLENGRLHLTEPEGSGRQKYIAADCTPSDDTSFMLNVKAEVKDKYGDRVFTTRIYATDFNVTPACAVRRIERMHKRGWLNREFVFRDVEYTLK